MLTGFGEKLLDYLLRGTTLTLPTNWYLGLDVSITGDDYVEAAYVGYARVAVPRASGSWATAVGAGQSVSAVDVVWPTCDVTAEGQAVRRVFISDSATSSGETLLDYIVLADSVDLVEDGEPTLVAGTLIVDAGD